MKDSGINKKKFRKISNFLLTYLDLGLSTLLHLLQFKKKRKEANDSLQLDNILGGVLVP